MDFFRNGTDFLPEFKPPSSIPRIVEGSTGIFLLPAPLITFLVFVFSHSVSRLYKTSRLWQELYVYVGRSDKEEAQPFQFSLE